MPMGYEISADAYLSRARKALAIGDLDALFYAAYELRCCVETRQAEYADALLAFKGTKIKPWKIGDTGKRIRRASAAKQISLLKLHVGNQVVESYHTPVTEDLVSFAEHDLGHLLHCQRIYRSQEDIWWAKTRERLLAGYRLAWVACRGDNMVPPIYNSKTGAVHPQRIAQMAHNQTLFDRPLQPGTKIKVEISYLDAPPASWVCDL